MNEIEKFLGLNILIIAGLMLGIFIYLVSLINKRRREKFLHKLEKEKKDQ